MNDQRTASAEPARPPGPSTEARRLVARLEIGEKVALLSGLDVWRTVPVERLDVPSIKVSDGPNGVRGDSTTGATAVCLPASLAVAATFDVELVAEVGRLLGRETVRKGAQVLLAPTINMARHPLGGRNFESFGEDPLLTAAIAVSYITGVQDEGVGACAKHFVANDLEEARLTVSSELDDRTLREVYLVPFEAAVEAGVWTVMAAYPKLNGIHCTENHWLLTTLLRDEWGFDGLVMSDWGATHHPTRSVLAGLDLEMPGPARALGHRLLAAVEAGEVPIPLLDLRAAAVIDLAVRSGRLGLTEDPERTVDLPAERELARRAAAEGMVLAANRPPPAPAETGDPARPLLPLDPGLGSLAVVGPNAEDGVIQGGGSAQLTPHHVVGPLAGLRSALPAADVVHRVGCLADRYLPQVPAGRWEAPPALEVFDNPELAGQPRSRRTSRTVAAFHHGTNPGAPDADRWSQRWTGRLPIEVGGAHRFGVLAVGRSRVLVDGELVADNWTAPAPGQAFFEKASAEVVGTVELTAGSVAQVVVEWSGGDDPDLAGLRFGHRPPVDEDALLAEAVDAAAGADAAVVVVGLTAEWETESHDRAMFGLPGRQDELIRRVAEANPRTVVVVNACGPVDLPWLDEVPATILAWYPGQEFGRALADVLLGVDEPGGRLPVTVPRTIDHIPTASSVPGDGRSLKYDEALFVGYRWYHEHGVEPRLPFGHGLSYTRFDLGQPVLRGPGAGDGQPDGRRLTVPVTNVGDRPGKCVVQAYLDPSTPGRPRVLAGFAVARPAPGATEEVDLAIDPKALRSWDGDRWQPLTGRHRLDVGLSAVDVAHALELTVD